MWTCNPPLEIGGKPLMISIITTTHIQTEITVAINCITMRAFESKNDVLFTLHMLQVEMVCFFFISTQIISTHRVFSHHLGRFECIMEYWRLCGHWTRTFPYIFFFSIHVCECCGSFMVIFPCTHTHTHIRNRVNNLRLLCPIENSHMK